MSVIYGNPITLGGGGLELVCNVDTGATVTATLGGKSVSGVSVDGQAVLKIPQEGKWTVSAVKGSMVSVQQDINVPATLDIHLISNELNDNSWAIIKKMSDDSMGANFWSVGDCKQITMNGKVSDGLTLTNYSAWVFIIGFNHNAEREGNGIAFQGFKATNKGTDVCLVDSMYVQQQTSGTWFSMNNSESNSGGWQASRMRTVVMPLIKAAFPSDLQEVIKPSAIFTTQGSGNGACTATTDEVFLLAEYEVFGVHSQASMEEQNYLKQYSYYSAGNSKVKYRHNSTGSAASWWLRSPRESSSKSCCFVNTKGKIFNNYANNSFGVSPAFKV